MRYFQISTGALLAGLAAALGTGAAMAADYSDVAPVISSRPIFERVNEPTRQCWNETATTQDRVLEHRFGVTYYAPVEETVQRCRTVDSYREEIRGYDVIYRYNGRDVHVQLPYDPGPTVRVDVGSAR